MSWITHDKSLKTAFATKRRWEISPSKCLTRTYKKTSHTTWSLNIKIQLISYVFLTRIISGKLYDLLYKLGLIILILEISPRLFKKGQD